MIWQLLDRLIYYYEALRRALRRIPVLMIPTVSIGRHTYGTPRILFWKEGARVEIGSYCSIADEVVIFAGGMHNTSFVSTYPFNRIWRTPSACDAHLMRKGGVSIGHDVWIGRHAAIMPGVRIGTGAVIAAYAVVTRDVPPYAIVAGVPARVVRMRFEQEVISQLLESAWWEWPDEEVRAIVPLLQSSNPQLFLQYVSQRSQGQRREGDV